MRDFTNFMEECERGPRLNELAEFFSETAGGRSGMPLRPPILDLRLLPHDTTLRQFIAIHALRQGPFDQHYLSSIPYRLEEECRLGTAILKYARSKRKPLMLYSLGTAEGTMARTISEIGGGKVESLSCSPNVENQRSFYAYGVPPHAQFFHGPFHHLTPERIRTSEGLSLFADGFDIILEDTTFQMYSANRFDQIRFVLQHLRADGLFVFVEKFHHDDAAEFRRREHQKDFGFKARYFSGADIMAKEDVVLTRMDGNEVTLAKMAATLKQFFLKCSITWNSGNFYSLVASNNRANLDSFVNKLSRPALPNEYIYDELPCELFSQSSLPVNPASE